MQRKKYILAVLVVALLNCTGCASFLPNQGGSRQQIVRSAKKQTAEAEATGVVTGIEIVDVTSVVTRQLIGSQSHTAFSSLVPPPPGMLGGEKVGPGDVLEVIIWETPPATLFGQATSGAADASNVQAGVNTTRFPEQQVTVEGTISVPFVGVVKVAGLTLQQCEKIIQERLKGKANAPHVMVRRPNNQSSTVTVVGEVNKSATIPLTPKKEHLLDILAAAEGAKQPVNKLLVQLTRSGHVYSMPLQSVICDTSQNILVEPGDIVTVLYQPLSFTVLGATGRNAEVDFEATGLTLAQALGRVGGLRGESADPAGVFIFRYEDLKALNWPKQPAIVTPQDKVPVIYRVDLQDAGSFFAAQSFPIKDKDVLYVATAPSVQFQKFLTLLSTVVNPAMSTTVQMHNISRY